MDPDEAERLCHALTEPASKDPPAWLSTWPRFCGK
jgi:hypothetical protein